MAGFATDDEENDLDVICIGAALVVDNKLYGAFSVSTPKYRFDREKTIANKKEPAGRIGQDENFWLTIEEGRSCLKRGSFFGLGWYDY